MVKKPFEIRKSIYFFKDKNGLFKSIYIHKYKGEYKTTKRKSYIIYRKSGDYKDKPYYGRMYRKSELKKINNKFSKKKIKSRKIKKGKRTKKKSGGGSDCTCYSEECSHCQDIREREEELVKEQAKQGKGKQTLDQEIKRSQDLILEMKQPSSCSEKSFDNMDILRYITSLGITLQEYNLLKQISSENGEPIENLLQFFNQYSKTGLTLHEIVEAYQLGGILEICEDLSECRTLLHSKKESIMLMRERMIKEFCKAKNDTGCVGITSPEFLKFLHYFRPPPESGDYPDNELLDYVRLWNDCDCGSQIDYSSPSVWRGQISL